MKINSIVFYFFLFATTFAMDIFWLENLQEEEPAVVENVDVKPWENPALSQTLQKLLRSLETMKLEELHNLKLAIQDEQKERIHRFFG